MEEAAAAAEEAVGRPSDDPSFMDQQAKSKAFSFFAAQPAPAKATPAKATPSPAKSAPAELTHKYATQWFPSSSFVGARVTPQKKAPIPREQDPAPRPRGWCAARPARGVRIRGTVSRTRVRSLQRRRRLTCRHVPSAGRRSGRSPPPGEQNCRDKGQCHNIFEDLASRASERFEHFGLAMERLFFQYTDSEGDTISVCSLTSKQARG